MGIAVLAVKAGLRAASIVAPNLAGKWTFALYCRLTPVRVRPAELEWHSQATVTELDYHGRRVVVYQWGDGGEPILLVHGWNSRGSRYATLAAELVARGFSPITFDAPGNGDSAGDRTTILEYAEVIGLLAQRYGRFRALVSHSFGTLAVFQALRSGVRADRVVSISGVCEMSHLVEHFSDELGLPARLRTDLTRRFADLFAPEQDIYLRFSVPYQAENVTVPILVVHDEDDKRVGMEQAKRIVAAFPGRARLVTTQGLGHSPILSDPTVIEVIADFLEQPTLHPTPE